MGPARSQWRVHCRPLSQAVSLYNLLDALSGEGLPTPCPVHCLRSASSRNTATVISGDTVLQATGLHLEGESAAS